MARRFYDLTTETRAIEHIEVYPFGEDSSVFSTRQQGQPWSCDEIQIERHQEGCWVVVNRRDKDGDLRAIFRVPVAFCQITYKVEST